MSINLPVNVLKEIRNLAKSYDIEKILLFGSRARGDHKHKSDIDLAVYTGPSFNRQGHFASAIDDLPTLLKIDVVFIDDSIDKKLLLNIMQEGVVIYERSEKQA